MNWEIANTIVGIIQIIVSLVLIASVLMQSAKKEGLNGVVGGASETFFGKNKGRTLDATFAVVTTVCAIIFLVSSLFLSYGMIAINNKTAAPAEVATEVNPEDIQVETDVPSEDAVADEGEAEEETEATDEGAEETAENADAESENAAE